MLQNQSHLLYNDVITCGALLYNDVITCGVLLYNDVITHEVLLHNDVITCWVVVERRAINPEDMGSSPATGVSKSGQFRSPHFACVFWRYAKSRWFLLSGVCVRGSKISHTGIWKKFVDSQNQWTQPTKTHN